MRPHGPPRDPAANPIGRSPGSGEVTIVLNGRPTHLAGAPTVADAVARSDAPDPPRGVAVAVEGEVVPRERWDRLELEDGQRVEIVQAVQGG